MDTSRLNMKQVFLTAAVTCVFTIIAGVATYLITSKSASLSYTVSSGPVLSSEQTHKRIFSVLVENTGRKEVNAPALQIQIPKGTICETSKEAPPGLTINETRTNGTYRIALPSLNPGERFGVSLMAYIPEPSILPIISVRGVGINGQETNSTKSETKQIPFLIAGALASILAMTLSITPMMRKLIGRSTIPASITRSFLRRESMVGPFDRNELIAFICSLSGLSQHSRQLRFAPSEVTFRGAADYLVSEALTTDSSEQKERFRLALQSMLLIKAMADDSVAVIMTAINLLTNTKDKTMTDEIRKHAVDQDEEPARLRLVLIDYIQSKGTKLPQQTH